MLHSGNEQESNSFKYQLVHIFNYSQVSHIDEAEANIQLRTLLIQKCYFCAINLMVEIRKTRFSHYMSESHKQQMLLATQEAKTKNHRQREHSRHLVSIYVYM